MRKLYKAIRIAITAILLITTATTHAQTQMKAVWVSTYLNIDWPSKPGLSKDAQVAEMTAIVAQAKACGLNTIILQVRSEYDAIYPSRLEPWSRVLTGKDGGDPGYDPLATAIALAHAQGLKLHAWVNPYRCGALKNRDKYTRDHVSRRMASSVRSFDTYFWGDPSDAALRAHTLKVIADIVKRYDIDGLHYDDYFYPYPKKGVPFPDATNFAAYQKRGGKMSIADWRRNNINEMVAEIYSTVKSIKPRCEVGISPFGIWKPGHPAGVTGLNQYDELFADPVLWMQKGWCDYLAPQLYWATDSKQPFEALLKWWAAQKSGRRVALVPGIAAYRITDSKWAASEITKQIDICNRTRGCDGYALFSMKQLKNNSGGLADALKKRR